MKKTAKPKHPTRSLLPHISGIILIICSVVTLVFFLRFDFAYSLKAYRVQPGDTLWGILTTQVFHHPVITAASVEYMKSQTLYPRGSKSYHLYHIEANREANIQDGDILFVSDGKLTIINAGGIVVLSGVPLLPPAWANNHAIQVVFYDVLILFLIAIINVLFFQRKTLQLRNVSLHFLLFIPLGLVGAGVIRIMLYFFNHM